MLKVSKLEVCELEVCMLKVYKFEVCKLEVYELKICKFEVCMLEVGLNRKRETNTTRYRTSAHVFY